MVALLQVQNMLEAVETEMKIRETEAVYSSQKREG